MKLYWQILASGILTLLPLYQAVGQPEIRAEATASVGEPTGQINLQKSADGAVKATLSKLLPNYPNVRRVEVKVEDGVVTVDGWVTDIDTRSKVTDFIRRVEGVKLVLNRMKLDRDMMSATEVVGAKFNDFLNIAAQRWLLWVLTLLVVIVFALLAKHGRRVMENGLKVFIPNGLLRSILGSLISPLFFFTGIFIALSLLNLTQTIMSMLGLAGVAGLAIGFAFRDITENFIASMLLGLRPPFRINDLVTIAGHTGTVASLNTRATVLITAEGNHIRIPNAIVFKEILINRTAVPKHRVEFFITIPHSVSLSKFVDALKAGLKRHPGVLPEPDPAVLVDTLDVGGIRLKIQGWVNAQESDLEHAASGMKLLTRVVLKELGIPPYGELIPENRAILERDRQISREQSTEASCEVEPTKVTSRDVVSSEGSNLLDERQTNAAQ